MTDPYDIDIYWLEEIILENNEHPCYDFKRELNFRNKDDKELEREIRAELIRDMISLGNQALFNQIKSYLIIGASDGNIIEISNTYDDSDFQNFLNAYITPALVFLYKQISITGKLIGVFIILPKGNSIFTVKKDYKNKYKQNLLTKGESWNRRGSSKYKITDNQQLLQLQTELTNLISSKSSETHFLSENLKQKFWTSYLTEKKFILKDLDFLGFNNLRDEPSVPLQELFMSLQFELESEVFQNPIIKKRIVKFVDTLNEKEEDLLNGINLPLEEEVTQDQLIKIFEKIRKIENSNYHKEMYIEFLYLFRYLLVIGGPGFGKTTFLKFIWLESEQKAIFSKYKINERQIPILISLLEYESFLIENRIDKSVKCSLMDFINLKITPKMIDDSIPINLQKRIVQEQLKNGNVILLLDGVDEVSDQQYRNQILKDIEFFGTLYSQCRIIITSRPLSKLNQLKKIGFFPLNVQPLQVFEINRFIYNWYTSKIGDVKAINKQANDLTHLIQINPELLNLARNPLMLTLMVIIHRIEGKIPERRVKLYQKTTNTFLETWDQKKGIQIQISMDLIKKSLSVLAFEIQNRFTQGSGLDISLNEAKRILVHHMVEKERQELIDAGNIVEEILSIFQARSGVLVLKNDKISFWHSTFKDYFAAQYIKNTYITDLEGLWEQISELIKEEKWIFIINLFFGLISELTLDIIFDFTDKILDSEEIPILNQIQVINDILLENPETTKHLVKKVFAFVLNELKTAEHQDSKTGILLHLHPIVHLISQEIIKELVSYILKEYNSVTAYQIGEQSGNIILKIFNIIYNEGSDFLFEVLKKNIPEKILNNEVQSQIESSSNDDLLLLRSMLEFPVLADKEVFFDYFSFILSPISDIQESKLISISDDHIKCFDTLLHPIQECKKVFLPSIFLYFYYLVKRRKISSHSQFTLIEPFGYFGKIDGELDYHPFKDDIWMILNIDHKFGSLLDNIQYEEGITKIVKNIPSRKTLYFYLTKRFQLEPFKPVRINFEMNPPQKMLERGEFNFRYRIQMKDQKWFITKKIDFADKHQFEEYVKQLTIFENQAKLFNIEIIREEEYTLVNQAFKYVRDKRMKKIEKGLELAQRALKLDEFFYPALYIKSEALGRLFKFEESNKVNSIIFKRFPRDSWVYYRQALNLARSLRFEEILSMKKSEDITNLNDAFFLLYKAEANSQLGEYQKADRLFNKIEPKLNDKIEYQIIKIEHLFRIEDERSARILISKVNQNRKEIDKLYYVRKLIMLNIKANNSSIIKKLITKGKEMGMNENEILTYQIEILNNKGKKQKALKIATRSIEKYPEDIILLNITGLIHLELKNISEARRLFKTAVEYDDSFPDGWYNLACTFALEGNVEEAIEYLTKASSLDTQIRILASNDDDFELIKHNKKFIDLISKNTDTPMS